MAEFFLSEALEKDDRENEVKKSENFKNFSQFFR